MSGFHVATATSRPDPFKRVKYQLGLVLGVDEFEQEQAYFLEADRRHARSLHGYGVVCGLSVTNDGAEVRVGPGLALSPKGRELRVRAAHCARIDEWLAVPDNRALLEAAPVPPELPPGTRSLYVTLCYLECETDAVPIPGAPCRSEEESMAPSRILESFDLKFAVAPPDQIEEEAVRAFGRLLDRLEVSSDPADEAISPEVMADEVRALLGLFPTDGSEPAVPSDAPLFVRPEQVDEVLGAAFHTWVSEVRPELVPGGCLEGPQGDDCIVLARVDFAVDEAWQVDEASVRIVTDDRPILLHTRLITELARYLAEGVTDHGKLSGLEDDDHPQYLLVDPATRALVGDLDGGGHLIKNIQSGTQPGEAVTADKAVKVDDPAGGDLQGTYPNPTVAGLRGAPVVDDPAKASGWVLTWSGTEWRPQPAPSGGGGGGITLEEVAANLRAIPFVTVTRAPRLVLDEKPESLLPTFELWFHLDVDAVSRANLPVLLPDFVPRVFVETDRTTPAASPFLTPIRVIDFIPKPGARNVFLMTVEDRVDLYQEVRIVFRPSEMTLEIPDEDRYALSDWISKRPVKWIGHDGADTITAFYKNDVRQKVVASGTYDMRGAVYAANNLEVPGSRPTDVSIDGEFITWTGYDVLKRHRYVVKGTPFWLENEIEMSKVPLLFRVLFWHKEGLFVSSREIGGGTPNLLVGTSVEISEIL